MSSQLEACFPELALIRVCNHALFLIKSPQRGGVGVKEQTLSGRLDSKSECMLSMPHIKTEVIIIQK